MTSPYVTPTLVDTHANLPAVAAASHIALVANDDGNGHAMLYRGTGSAWVPALLLVSALYAGGTANRVLGTADGANVAWGTVAAAAIAPGPANTVLATDAAPSTGWSGSPTLSTSLRVVPAGATSTIIQALVGSSAAAIYMGSNATTPSATNYALATSTSGNSLFINAPGGGAISFFNPSAITEGVQLLTIQQVGGENHIRFGPNRDALISILGPGVLGDIATHNLYIKGQAPFATAVNFKNPGNIILGIPSPIAGGGVRGYTFFENDASIVAAIGRNAYPAGQSGDVGGSIWLGITSATTPSSTNWTLDSNGVNLNRLNSPSATIGGTSIYMGGEFRITVSASGLFVRNDAAYKLAMFSRTTDTAPFDLTIESSGPFAGASPGVNQNSGSLIRNIPAPVGAGSYGSHKWTFGGAQHMVLTPSSATATGSTALLHLGTGAVIMPSSGVGNFVLAGNGTTTTNLNAPSGGAIVHSVSNSPVWIMNSTSWSGTSIQAALIAHQAAALAGATVFDFTMRSMAPHASSTGAAGNSGNFTVDIPAPVDIGTRGSFKVTHATASAFEVNSVSQYTLFGNRTFTAGSGAPGGTPLEGQMYMRTGPTGTGDLLVGVNGVWVSTTSGASGFVPTSRQIIAGAGMSQTPGTTLAADMTLNVGQNADGSIVVNANDIQVGVLATDAQHGARGGGTQHTAVTNAAAGFAPAISGAARVLMSADGVSATWVSNAPSSLLGQGGAAVGQALIWSGSAWTPGTNFGAQNLNTSGTLNAGATTLASLVVSGNLTVNGSTTIVNSTTVDVADRVIRVNKSTGVAPVPSQITGISVYRGSPDGSTIRDHVGLFWDEANQTWQLAFNTAGDDATVGADLALRALGLRLSGLTTGIAHVGATGILSSSLIVNADIASGAAVAVNKLANGTSGQLLTVNAGAGGVPAWTTMGGNVTGPIETNKVVGLTGVGSPGVVTHSGTTITTALTEFVIEQTGDSLGASRIRVRNRAAMSGLVVEASGLDVIDIRLAGASVASNIRLEGRGGQMKTGNTEWQVGVAGAPTLAIGSTSKSLWLVNDSGPPPAASGGITLGATGGSLRVRSPNNLRTTLAGEMPAGASPAYKHTVYGTKFTAGTAFFDRAVSFSLRDMVGDFTFSFIIVAKITSLDASNVSAGAFVITAGGAYYAGGGANNTSTVSDNMPTIYGETVTSGIISDGTFYVDVMGVIGHTFEWHVELEILAYET